MSATSAPLSIPATARTEAQPVVGSRCHRYISPQAGHALEILGHAIEYLTDEYVHEGRSISANDPQVKAVQILMAVNRKIYLECPIVPTIAERLRNLLHISSASAAGRFNSHKHA
jgi:hypothetical protein